MLIANDGKKLYCRKYHKNWLFRETLREKSSVGSPTVRKGFKRRALEILPNETNLIEAIFYNRTTKTMLKFSRTMKLPSFALFATFAVIFCASSLNFFSQKTTSDPKNYAPTVGNSGPKVVKIDELSIKELLKPKKKPLLINFWATWCIPCREEFPDLVEIDKEFKGEIDFITISLDDLAEINRDVPKFLAEMKASMPAYLLYTNDENGVIGSISKDWAGGLPFTVLYSETGDVEHTKQGKIKPEIVKEKISNLLAGKTEGK